MKMKILVYIFLLAGLLTGCTKKWEDPPQSTLHIVADLSKLNLPSGSNPELSNIKLTMYALRKWEEGSNFLLDKLPATVTVTKGIYYQVKLNATVSYQENGNTATVETSASINDGNPINFTQDNFTRTFEIVKKN